MSAPDPTPRLATAMVRWFEQQVGYGVFITDTELRIQSWNTWIAEATGRPAEEAIGSLLFDVFPSLVDRGLDLYFTDALNGQAKVLSQALHRFVLPLTRQNGEPIAQSGRIAPLMDGDRVIGTITTIEDVSERLATERELRAQIATAERARITAEAASRVKDEFLATLSHEIRTPLNAVLGWTRILRSRQPDMETVRRAVEVIDRNASAQLTLISDMLDIARISAGKVRLEVSTVDLVATALAAIDVVRPAADAKGVTIVTDLPPVPILVSGDPDRLQQIAWNLLSNAVKFTDGGGRVQVGVSLQQTMVVLTVSDTGHGIEPAFIPQVFQRFKQADPSSSRRYGGLGLGLALVRELSELHGGSVDVESAGLGHGSTFSVRLPLKASEVEDRVPPALLQETGSADLHGVCVLVVDDDADGREIVVTCLEDAGATIVAAESAAGALALLKTCDLPQLPHVIVTDIGMPGADGYALLKDVRKLPPEFGGTTPIVAVTAYGTAQDRRQALSAGFHAHVAKPFAPVTLVSVLARIAHETSQPAASPAGDL